MKLRGGHFDRSITKNQRHSKDFSAASIRVPHSFYSRLPTKGAAYQPLKHLNQLVNEARVAPCQEKLVFGVLNRTIEADESGQQWKQSHQRPDQGPTFGDCGGSNPSAEGDDAYRD
jgi:hypothetical protein